jgi:heme-degrading monooxygenase HmoA
MRRDGGAVRTLPRQRRQIVYARTTTIEAKTSSIDAGIAHIRETVMPALEGFEGYIGLSLLVDRSTGRCITTSAWESEEAMRSSTQAVREIRDRAAQIFGGTADVDEWEIAVLHREHQSGEGACVRVTWVKVNPDQVDRGIDIFKTTVLPALEELEGLCGASLLMDRASGRAVSSAAYENAEAVERNRVQLDMLRAGASEEANAQVIEERDFELAIAQLRVPEMA